MPLAEIFLLERKKALQKGGGLLADEKKVKLVAET